MRARGKPAATAVSAAGWGVTTQWVYNDSGRRLYVDFVANTVVSKGEAEE